MIRGYLVFVPFIINPYFWDDKKTKDMYSIRRATTEDCGLIHTMAWEAFPHTYRDILSSAQIEYMMHMMYDAEVLRRQMTQEGHEYFIASDTGGMPVGYVSVRPDGEDIVHLEKIYVLPHWQNAHCGRTLFRYAVSYVREARPEVRAIELNVNRCNPALGFYRRMGMRIKCEGDFAIGNGFYMNDYIMCLEL